MVIQDSSEQSGKPVAEPYDPPKLTKFGTIEEWTHGVLGGLSVSIVL